MQPLLDIPLYSQFWADQGANLLANGDFEGAAGPPPAGWLASQCVATRQTGARTGSTGLYVGREAYDGVNAVGLMYQAGIFTAGRRYHNVVWANGFAGAQLWSGDNGGQGWTGLGTGAWKVGDVTFVAAGAQFRLQCSNFGPGLSVDWDDVDVREQFLYTENRGSLKGKVQLGDGRTAASFPLMLPLTQACRKGMLFDGGDYMQWMSPVTSSTFTPCFLVSRAAAGAAYLLDAGAGGGAGSLQWSGAAMSASTGTVYVDDTATTALGLAPLCFVAVSGITISAPTKIVVGASNASASPWTGNLFGFRLFPGTLTPRQLSDIRQRMLAEVFGP